MSDTLEGDWMVTKVVAIVKRDGEEKAWTRWDGYNFLGDTWEPTSHLGKLQSLCDVLERWLFLPSCGAKTPAGLAALSA